MVVVGGMGTMKKQGVRDVVSFKGLEEEGGKLKTAEGKSVLFCF